MAKDSSESTRIFFARKSFRMTLTTAVATSGAATANGYLGSVTSEALSTAAAALYTLTITNDKVNANSKVFAKVKYGTSTTGEPEVQRITEANGSVVIILKNGASAAALNGTIVVDFFVINPA